jgi:hypothetical protein
MASTRAERRPVEAPSAVYSRSQHYRALTYQRPTAYNRELRTTGRGAFPESVRAPSRVSYGRLICAVGLSARDHLLAYLTAQRQAGADIELRVDERVEGGIAGIRCHAAERRGIGRKQV